jgi:ABC-2 type transport system permease protein
MEMLVLIKDELVKTYTRWRTYIGFLAVGVLVPLFMVAVKLQGGPLISERAIERFENYFIVSGNITNGLLVSYILLNTLWVHVPFLIALVAGEMISGEATGGTIRMLLTRPVRRSRVILVKFATTVIYTVSLVGFLGLVSLSLGSLIFGRGDLLVLDKGLLIIPQAEAWQRVILAYVLGMWSMCVVASLAFFFSALVDNSIGPIIGTMVVLFSFLIISNTPYSLFKEISPYLFTHYADVWRSAFSEPIPWGDIMSSVAYLGAYTLALFVISLYWFRRKDILA